MTRRDALVALGSLAAMGAIQPPRAATDAVVFDAYGTLFDVHSVVALANKLFPGRGDALSQRWRAKQLEYTWTLSLMGRYEDFWAVTAHALTFACRAVEVTCRADDHARLMDAYLQLSAFPDAVTGLKALSGRTLAILSNGSPKMLAAVVSSAGFNGLFKQVISVDELRIYKPNPRVYQLAVDALAVRAPSVLFVSSNAWDVAGAKAFGFRTCWVNRDGAPSEELGLNADIVIRTLDALPRAL